MRVGGACPGIAGQRGSFGHSSAGSLSLFKCLAATPFDRAGARPDRCTGGAGGDWSLEGSKLGGQARGSRCAGQHGLQPLGAIPALIDAARISTHDERPAFLAALVQFGQEGMEALALRFATVIPHFVQTLPHLAGMGESAIPVIPILTSGLDGQNSRSPGARMPQEHRHSAMRCACRPEAVRRPGQEVEIRTFRSSLNTRRRSAISEAGLPERRFELSGHLASTTHRYRQPPTRVSALGDLNQAAVIAVASYLPP